MMSLPLTTTGFSASNWPSFYLGAFSLIYEQNFLTQSKTIPMQSEAGAVILVRLERGAFSFSRESRVRDKGA